MAKRLNVIEGKYIYLKPVSNKDAFFIVSIRNHPEYSRYIHDGAKTIKEQTKWLKKYYTRGDNYYFIIVWKNGNKRIGTIAIYNIDWNSKKAEWGRWIVDNNPLAAIESMFLIYNYSFNVLGMEKMYFTTVTKNTKVVKIHDAYGAQRIKVLKRHLLKQSECYDEYQYEVRKSIFYDKIKTFFEKMIG